MILAAKGADDAPSRRLGGVQGRRGPRSRPRGDGGVREVAGGKAARAAVWVAAAAVGTLAFVAACRVYVYAVIALGVMLGTA